MSATLENTGTCEGMLVDAGLPEYFVGEQEAAKAEYEAAPAPKRTDEAWRFSDLSAIKTEGFVETGPVASEGRVINQSRGLETVAGRMIFGNNALLSREADGLPEGVLFLPLEQALREHESLIREFSWRSRSSWVRTRWRHCTGRLFGQAHFFMFPRASRSVFHWKSFTGWRERWCRYFHILWWCAEPTAG